TEAVRQGIYVPLGQGDVDFAHIVSRLNDAGYDGWYVIEQDTILASAADAAGSKADVEGRFRSFATSPPEPIAALRRNAGRPSLGRVRFGRPRRNVGEPHTVIAQHVCRNAVPWTCDNDALHRPCDHRWSPGA